MSNRNNSLLIAAGITLLAGITFTACQQNSLPPEHPINKGDRPPLVSDATEGIYPTLKLTSKNSTDPAIPGQSKEFKLKSQTSRFTNDKQSAIELTLTDSKSSSCENQNPELKEGESIIKLNIQSKDNSALAKGSYAADKFNITGAMTTMLNGAKQEEKFSSAQVPAFTVTDLNKAIFRGSFKTAGDKTALDGEFFTAICH